MFKVTLAVISNRQVKPQTTQALLELVAKGGYDFHFTVAQHGYTIAENRTVCAIRAKKNNSDYLFFIDDDMVFPPDTLEILIRQDKDIIGPAYRARTMDSKRSAALLEGGFVDLDATTEEKYKTTFECNAKGTGVMLINMKIFKVMEKPWFDFIYDKKVGVCTLGEDYFFCRKAKELGFTVWCDPTILVGHIGDYSY